MSFQQTTPFLEVSRRALLVKTNADLRGKLYKEWFEDYKEAFVISIEGKHCSCKMLTLILFRKLEIDEIIARATEHVLFLQHQFNCKEVRLVNARENILVKTIQNFRLDHVHLIYEFSNAPSPFWLQQHLVEALLAKFSLRLR